MKITFTDKISEMRNIYKILTDNFQMKRLLERLVRKREDGIGMDLGKQL
jgi:hypothetical protein